MIESIPKATAEDLHWYIQIKTRESGPYSYIEILSLLHNKDIESENLITYRGLGGWHRVSEFINFSPKNLSVALDANNIDPNDSNDVSFRRSLRIPISSEVLTTVDDYVFRSTCVDLSTGSCLIKLDTNEKIKPDAHIKIHFYENTEIKLKSFNISGEVIRILSAKKLGEGYSHSNFIRVQFTDIKKSEKEVLKNRISKITLTTPTNITIDKILKRHSTLEAA